MDPNNTPLDVEFDGRTRRLYFDIDTIETFEEASGKSYMNWAMDIFHGTQKAAAAMAREATGAIIVAEDASEEEKLEAAERRHNALIENGIDAMRLASVMTMRDFRCILYAAYHEPGDKIRKPRWPMSIDQVRAKVDESVYLKISPLIVTAVVSNMSRKMGVKQAEPERPTNLSPIKREPTGGSISGPSDADVLASLEMK